MVALIQYPTPKKGVLFMIWLLGYHEEGPLMRGLRGYLGAT